MKEIEQIKNICKKHPQIQKHIIDVVLKEDNNFSSDKLNELISEYSIHKNLLKNKEFNIFEYKTVEGAFDKISAIILDAKALKFIKSHLSVKDKHLANKETLELIKKAVSENLELKNIELEIFRKIVKYKNVKKVNEAISDVIEHQRDDIDKLKDRIESQNTEVIEFNKEKGVIVAKINDYAASNKLGSKSWCISTSKTFWNDYVEKRQVLSTNFSPITKAFLKKIKNTDLEGLNYQFFIWDKRKASPLDLIGLTYTANLTKVAGHSRDDSYNNSSIFSYIDRSQLKKDESLKGDKLIRVINNLAKSTSKYSKNDNIGEILIDLDIYKFDEMIKLGKIEKTKKIQEKIAEKINSVDILKSDYLGFAIKNNIFKEKLKYVFSNQIKKETFKSYTIQHILNHANTLNKNGHLSELEYRGINDKIKKTYLESLSTIPIENPTVRGLLEEYIGSVDLGKANNVNGMIAKTIGRAIKQKQTQWVKDTILKKDISLKIIIYSFIHNYLNHPCLDRYGYKMTPKNNLKEFEGFIEINDLLLQDKINYDIDGLSKNEMEKVAKIAEISIDFSITTKNKNVMNNGSKSNIIEFNYVKGRTELALKLMNAGYLDNWIKSASIGKLNAVKDLIECENISVKCNGDMLKNALLEKDVEKWVRVILKGEDYSQEKWDELKSNKEQYLKVKAKVVANYKNYTLLEDIITDNVKPKRKNKPTL